MLYDGEEKIIGRELVPVGGELVQISEDMTPTFFRDAGPKATKRFIRIFCGQYSEFVTHGRQFGG